MIGSLSQMPSRRKVYFRPSRRKISPAISAIPSKQLVNAVGGAKPARNVCIGDKLWTLHNGEVKETTVTHIDFQKVHEVVEVVTSRGILKVTTNQPLATPQGWVEAKDIVGRQIKWTHARSLCRERYTPKLGHAFGYVVGAMCADGTVANRYISLVVNEEHFAQAFADALYEAFTIDAHLESVTRPSGFLNSDLPGFRVRVVSSYLADLFRQYVGGDAHHMHQQFPFVVLNSLETFEGFIDGYVEGDGFRKKNGVGRMVVSANIPFLQTFAQLIGARFTPYTKGHASCLYISDSWYQRHGFQQQDHRTTLLESEWAEVLEVRDRSQGQKLFSTYSFMCEPYPSFLVNGHLVHNCNQHHLLPFWCEVAIGYLPDDNVLGLSKFARIAQQFAHRLQLQERMGQQIANEITRITGTMNVAVVLTGEHYCMAARGIRSPGRMTSSVMRGVFRTDSATRLEFLRLIE